MKNYLKVLFCLVFAIIMVSAAVDVSAQTRPRASQRQMVVQTVGTAEITIVYHRPNVKGRKIWGTAEEKALVPYGDVWRAGANENTTFEVSQDITVNGQALPKGKYGFHVIPGKTESTLIFNKVNDVWGTVKPKKENDALRINVTNEEGAFQESLSYLFEDVIGGSAHIVLAWDKMRIPFNIEVGGTEDEG